MDEIEKTAETAENIDVQIMQIDDAEVEVVAHFSGGRTYDDIIRDALRREFSE